MGLSAAVYERRIGWGGGVGMQRLKRVDQDACYVAPVAQDLERAVGHLGQRVGVVGGGWVADAGLNVAPPAVIGAAESDQVGAVGVIAGQADCLHDRFGAGHVEGD